MLTGRSEADRGVSRMAIADPAFVLKGFDDGQAAYPDALRFVLKVKDGACG